MDNSMTGKFEDRSDPSQNVSKLVTTAITAQEKHFNSEIRRLDDTISCNKEHIKELLQLHITSSLDLEALRAVEFKDHIEYEKERMENEQVRINGVIASMQHAYSDDKVVASETARTLKMTVDTTASFARDKLEQTEKALSLSTEMAMETLRRNISQKNTEYDKKFKALEDAMSEGVGKARVSGPLYDSIFTELRELRDFKTSSSLKFSGLQSVGGWIIPIIVTVIIFILNYFHK